jgi:uncharacterized protein (TIGR02569 family)
VTEHLGEPPPPQVLDAFGARGVPAALPGGQGKTWIVDGIVLKPVDLHPDELEWLGHVGIRLPPHPDLGLSFPLRGKSGRLVEDGWIAFPAIEGRSNPDRWNDLAAVARRFASVFRDEMRPAFIDERMHAWAQADRVAWDESASGVLPDRVPRLDALARAKKPIADPAGIVHGDVAGNVLFAAGKPPAVIDLTMYWRPVEYSVAIVAVDSVCFGGAPLSIFETISESNNFPQYLIRATIFRLYTDWLNRLPAIRFRVYDAAVDRILTLAANEPRPARTSLG